MGWKFQIIQAKLKFERRYVRNYVNILSYAIETNKD